MGQCSVYAMWCVSVIFQCVVFQCSVSVWYHCHCGVLVWCVSVMCHIGASVWCLVSM